MYQCKLQIMIFSKDPMLPEVMDTLCPPERFSHTVTVSYTHLTLPTTPYV